MAPASGVAIKTPVANFNGAELAKVVAPGKFILPVITPPANAKSRLE